MIKGFKEDGYIYAIDTEKMDDTEIKKLAELYNKKLLTYKYRERFITEAAFYCFCGGGCSCSVCGQIGP